MTPAKQRIAERAVSDCFIAWTDKKGRWFEKCADWRAASKLADLARDAGRQEVRVGFVERSRGAAC